MPALVGLLLQGLSERHVKAVSEQINRFFSNIWEQTFDDKLENSGDSTINSRTAEAVTHGYKTIIQYMLDIVNFVRIQRNFYRMRQVLFISILINAVLFSVVTYYSCPE